MSATSLKPATAPVKTPYESDPYSWAREQARALREKRAEELDWQNLAEEVEDLANRHADALESHCETPIEHLLKLAYTPRRIREDNLRLWRASVRNARHKIANLLKHNPGLGGRCDELFDEAWPLARNAALGCSISTTRLSLKAGCGHLSRPPTPNSTLLPASDSSRGGSAFLFDFPA